MRPKVEYYNGFINKLSRHNSFTRLRLNPLQNKHSPASLECFVPEWNSQLHSGKLIAWKRSCFLISRVLLWHLANDVECGAYLVSPRK